MPHGGTTATNRTCDRVHHDSWSRTPSSALPNEAHPPRGRFLVTSNLENRDHIRPGHEDLKTFVPSPRAIPASIRSGKESRRVAKFSKRTRHRKARRSRPLAEIWVQQLPAPWKFLKPGSVNHELYPFMFPHPHIPSLSAAAHRSLRQATSPGWRLNGRCRHPEAEVGAAAYLNSLGKAVGETAPLRRPLSLPFSRSRYLGTGCGPWSWASDTTDTQRGPRSVRKLRPCSSRAVVVP